MSVEDIGSQGEILNPFQKNALRISLMLVDKGMCEVNRLLSEEEDGVLFRITDDLGEETATGIRHLVQGIREILRELKNRFELDVQIDQKSRAISGKLPLLWEIVTDTDASRLRGYGKIDPSLKEVLNPGLERLSDMLLRMQKLLANPPTGR